jgi:hypothetical protein
VHPLDAEAGAMLLYLKKTPLLVCFVREKHGLIFIEKEDTASKLKVRAIIRLR